MKKLNFLLLLLSTVAFAQVGIGTTDPKAQLDVNGGGIHVNGSNPVTGTEAQVQGAHLQWNRSGSQGETWLINQRGISPVGNFSGIRFGESNLANTVTEWARFDDNGNFGIGIIPTAKLHTTGSVRFAGLTTAGYVTTDASGNISSVVIPAIPAAVTASNGLNRDVDEIKLGGTLTQTSTFIDMNGNSLNFGNGNVGIGLAQPTAQLHTTGGVRFAGLITAGYVTTDASGNLSSVPIPATVTDNTFFDAVGNTATITDVTGTTFTIISRSSIPAGKYLVNCSVYGSKLNGIFLGQTSLIVRLLLNGAEVGNSEVTIASGDLDADNVLKNYSNSFIINIPAGGGTLTLQGESTNTAGAVSVRNRYMSIVRLN